MATLALRGRRAYSSGKGYPVIEKQTYDLLSRIFGKHKGVLLVVILVLGWGYPVGKDVIFRLMGEGVPPWAQQIENAVNEINEKLEPIYSVAVADMVRFVEKQHEKVIKNPDHLYAIDLRHAVDVVWPALPGSLKTPTLTEKYQIVENAYHSTLNSGG